MTGRDTITARFMRAEWFDFKPEFTPWLATNHKPQVRGTDKAIWDRIRLIPFTVTIPDAEQDLELPDKLRVELPGILAWAVEGCIEWQEERLGNPPEVAAATETYRAEQDILANFIEDSCVLGEDKKAAAKDLYAAYRKWCQENGEDPIGKVAFGTKLGERGLGPSRTGGERRWRGIGLVTQPGLG
jgi:putative DNA primase/helicase